MGSEMCIRDSGVDATDAAKAAVKSGSMTGTIKQDAAGMADTITQIAENFFANKSAFNGVAEENLVGTWRVNIPYSAYTAQSAD